jgi:hypothetical protein
VMLDLLSLVNYQHCSRERVLNLLILQMIQIVMEQVDFAVILLYFLHG